MLGPLLFNIYVNDMKDDNDVNSNIIQYADDTFIFCSRKQFLNQSYILKKVLLNSFSFRKNGLYVNESKTEFIIFGAPKRNKIE